MKLILTTLLFSISFAGNSLAYKVELVPDIMPIVAEPFTVILPENKYIWKSTNEMNLEVKVDSNTTSIEKLRFTLDGKRIEIQSNSIEIKSVENAIKENRKNLKREKAAIDDASLTQLGIIIFLGVSVIMCILFGYKWMSPQKS